MIYLENVPIRSSSVDYTQVLILKHLGRTLEAQDILRNHKSKTRAHYRSKKSALTRTEYYSYLRSQGLCYGNGGMCLQPVEEGKKSCRDCLDKQSYYQALHRFREANKSEVAASE